MVTDFLSLDAYGFRRDFIFDKSYSSFMSFTSVVRGFGLCRLASGMMRMSGHSKVTLCFLAFEAALARAVFRPIAPKALFRSFVASMPQLVMALANLNLGVIDERRADAIQLTCQNLKYMHGTFFLNTS